MTWSHHDLVTAFGKMTCQITREALMTWKTPKIVEVQVGMEINMYACAARR
jgi:coenzyme PQQ precursor peptide PqqA